MLKNFLQYKSFYCFIIVNIFCCAITKSFSQSIDSLRVITTSKTTDDLSRYDAYKALSRAFQSKNLKESESNALQALSVAEKMKSDSLLCDALSQLGNVYCWLRKTNDALTTYFREKEIAEKNKDNSMVQDALLGISYTYELENDWSRALDYTLRAIELLSKSGDAYDSAYAYNFLGTQYLGLDMKSQAKHYLGTSVAILKNLYHEPDLQADCEQNLAKVFVAENNIDSATYYYNDAIHLFSSLHEPYQVADVYQHMGDMYVSIGKFDKARNCYEEVLKNYNEDDVSAADYALAKLGLGVVALSEEKYDSASLIFHTEYQKIKDANIRDEQLQYLKYMSTVDSTQGRYLEALNHTQQYVVLFDSISNEKKFRTAQRMSIEMGVQQKEKENEQLKLQNNLQKQRTTALAIMGIILLLAGIFLAIMYRQKNAALASVKELQAATEAKNKQLAVINAIRDKLISMIAHDVRSPLTSLQNTLYLTREKIIHPEEFSELSQMLDHDIRHLISMLDNTLLWAREQIHTLNVEKESFNLCNLVQDVAQLYHQMMDDKKLRFVNNVSPSIFVISDREIIHTVLRNILSNAIKFSLQETAITIDATIETDHVLVSVKDEGTGIPYNILEKISKKEFISTRGTNNEKGTGLGLMFSYDLLAKLNESLSIRSEPGNGTAVFFSISYIEPELTLEEF